jgi:hypothetical protein
LISQETTAKTNVKYPMNKQPKVKAAKL